MNGDATSDSYQQPHHQRTANEAGARDGQPQDPAGKPREEAVDEEWMRIADTREEPMPKLGGAYPIAGLLRRARRVARVSQRELARRAGVSPSTVARVESGAIVPTLPAFERMLAVAGLRLVVVDDEGHVLTPMRDIADTRNGGGWRYPSHLDVILDPRPGEWWGDNYGLARPPETFHRDHDRRKAKQARSAWEVRVSRHRHAPEPPDVDTRELVRARLERQPAKPAPPKLIDSRTFDVDEWSDDDVREWHSAADDVSLDREGDAGPLTDHGE
jgi:transcriptional regulator with XRE-family HTH domain